MAKEYETRSVESIPPDEIDERLEITRSGRTIEIRYHTSWHTYCGRGLHMGDALTALANAYMNGLSEWSAADNMTKWQDERGW